jgi:hypothetical protein
MERYFLQKLKESYRFFDTKTEPPCGGSQGMKILKQLSISLGRINSSMNNIINNLKKSKNWLFRILYIIAASLIL